MLLNHNEGETTDFPHETKSTLSLANLPPLKPHNNKQTREKSQVVMKGFSCQWKVIMLPQAINFKAAALTAYLSTLGFTKRMGLCGPFRVRTHKDSTYGIH
jgi:hypothetical protein